MVRLAGHTRGILPDWLGNNSFAFPGNLNTIYCCMLNAACVAGGRSESKSQGQLGRRQGAAPRTASDFVLYYLGDLSMRDLCNTHCLHVARWAVRVWCSAPLVRPAGHARGSLPEWPGNNSFAFPGNLKIIYCCRLSAGCGAGGRLHVICYTMLVAPQTLSTSWCGLTPRQLEVGCFGLRGAPEHPSHRSAPQTGRLLLVLCQEGR